MVIAIIIDEVCWVCCGNATPKSRILKQRRLISCSCYMPIVGQVGTLLQAILRLMEQPPPGMLSVTVH